MSTRSNPDHETALKDEIESNSSAPQTPTSNRGLSVDPALLDEEDIPELSEHILDESSDGSTKNARRRLHIGGEAGYNSLKTFNGQVYSGMAVGGSHTWNYDQGVWKETKEEPDLWKIDYKTTKRREKKAPKGSGAPLGTQYHWLIVAHQVSYEYSNVDTKQLLIY